MEPCKTSHVPGGAFATGTTGDAGNPVPAFFFFKENRSSNQADSLR